MNRTKSVRPCLRWAVYSHLEVITPPLFSSVLICRGLHYSGEGFAHITEQMGFADGN